MRRKESSIELSLKEKAKLEREQCERTILNRLYASPARIEDLDRTGFPKKLINAVVNDLLHRDRITFSGFTYFYNHLQDLAKRQAS